MSMIDNDWLPCVQGEFKKPYYRELYQFIRQEYNTHVIYPPADDIFNAFHFTPLSKVKVLILGQDPYHGEHQAHGLCFSVLPDQPEIPPSLQNIYKELETDVGCYIPNNGYLKKWADQGVLLLNTVLTVRAHQAGSHQGKGWEQFTDAIIEAVNAQDRPVVYLLWGKPAQSKIPMLTNPKHLILKAPHPSPLSAYRGFFGCRHFSQTNEFLQSHGIEPIDWQIENSTDAIIVCGTTGEAATMTQKERMETIAYCVDRVAGRVPVIAGTGANDTQVARENALAAERLGVDGLLIVTPYYNKATQQGLLRHYKVIADSVGTPIILYNVPSRTGVNIQPETYAELAQHPNIAGVKEASGNFSQIQKTRNLCPADFSIWSGNDDETAAICMLGGSGVISVVANVLPAEMHRLTALCLADDFSAAGRLQLKLKPLCDALFCEVNPIPVKTALNLMGLEAGELRLPLCPPTDASVERLKLALSSWDLLPEQTP